MLTGIIPDLHLKKFLSYSDNVEDQRLPEKKEILDFIVESFKMCEKIVFMGDQFNSRSPQPEITEEFIHFLEQFDGKKIYILRGNHEVLSSEKSVIDYLKEVKGKNWKIITNIEQIGNFTFLPYKTLAELGVRDKEDGVKKIMAQLKNNDILFAHFAIADSKIHDIPVSIFNEPVLNRIKLEKKYKKIFGSHVHAPQIIGNTIICGSAFNMEVGETQKYIWILDEKTLKVEKIKLPGRMIIGLTDPTLKDLEKIDKSSIVKVTITKKLDKKDMAELKDKLEEYDAHMLIENIPTERKKIDIEKGGLIDFNIENLLQLYSKERSVPLEKLKQAFELIK